MKQHITPKQLNELSEKGKAELFKWRVKKGYARNPDKKTSPFLSIGQLLEYLIEHDYFMEDFTFDKHVCDSLWKEVREHLDSKGQ